MSSREVTPMNHPYSAVLNGDRRITLRFLSTEERDTYYEKIRRERDEALRAGKEEQ